MLKFWGHPAWVRMKTKNHQFKPTRYKASFSKTCVVPCAESEFTYFWVTFRKFCAAPLAVWSQSADCVFSVSLRLQTRDCKNKCTGGAGSGRALIKDVHASSDEHACSHVCVFVCEGGDVDRAAMRLQGRVLGGFEMWGEKNRPQLLSQAIPWIQHRRREANQRGTETKGRRSRKTRPTVCFSSLQVTRPA